ncbi:MAG TPA: carbamoyltransferase HypF [Microscillaceae bacterium]|nr:carbamoyltransferase HypF [Microscillaceae bacterium]
MQKTFQIQISGRVQGVGFRPFVFTLAQQHTLSGVIYNNEQGVIIKVNATPAQVCDFVEELLLNPPPVARILRHQVTEIAPQNFEGFRIVASAKNSQINLPLTPDFAICPDCQTELTDPENRRFHYPFITCVNCGPRYAITQQFPFERDHTSVVEFPMCTTCESEYTTPENRRFHAQTNSCPECGVQIRLKNNAGEILASEATEVFTLASQAIRQGQIVAIKNTSGYILACDATNVAAVQQLRVKKQRPTKPLALLCKNLTQAQKYAHLTQKETKALTSTVAPIIIAAAKAQTNLATTAIAPGLREIGVMLPSSGIFVLLMQHLDFPIVATSGNIHGSPILSEETQVQEALSEVADLFIHHNLEVQFPQDDSVVKYAPKSQRKIVLRRSRGMAPNYLPYQKMKPTGPAQVLAMGSHLKSTFALLPNEHLYISQYFGNLQNYEVSARYARMLQSYIQLFDAKPSIILTDMHLGYQSTIIGQELSATWGSKLYPVQHHQAHFAAVLAEHHLFDDQVLGVVWDGTGLGDDQAIWGGEFFGYASHKIERIAHLEYFDWLAADKMAAEPRLSLLSLASDQMSEQVQAKFSPLEWKVYQNRLSKSTQKTSSMGRLFDAVAALLIDADFNAFEGEAAMLLEAQAQGYDPDQLLDYLAGETYTNLPAKLLLERIYEAKKQQVPIRQIAANFIYTLVESIRQIAQKAHLEHIAFSGGVFQNALLVDMIETYLSQDFSLYFHSAFAPNDENIAFGQLMYYQHIIDKENQPPQYFSDQKESLLEKL